MSIYVVRHAEKQSGDFHHEGLKFNDQPITKAGMESARRLVAFFSPIDIASIHVSEYLRTQQTIAFVAESKGLVPLVDRRINEIDIGVIEEMTDTQVEEQYPDFWAAYHTRDHEFRMPGGETGYEAQKRIRSLFDSLDRTKNHILCTHEGLTRILLCSVLGLPAYRRHLFSIDYASITVFEYLPDFHCWTVPKVNMVL
ncbi:Phosphoserine phosphatase 1 [bioreactor metagenome]|jgi:broad specificity phosphatase PhoE|uniref:Histidine phosphatase family protein n=2 Tax=root TaxID=1 RepID=A0ABY4DCD8_9SPIR|nr:histidine phosphatase family protein [Sphaerochaeta associata]UOM51934.1 histidine phosphatase family protein [Sphaerochaeta associata]SMP58412.1 probable phosphoglycerate mutase [Sphaerochaeta associata]